MNMDEPIGEVLQTSSKRRPLVSGESYDIESAMDRDRLLRDTVEYARISVTHGTNLDSKGRRSAYNALRDLMIKGARLAPPDSTP